jgi:hypothetical protein
MASRKRAFLLVAVVALLGVMALLIVGFVTKDRSAELKKSIATLLEGQLKLQHASIDQEKLPGWKETDPSGFWIVSVGDKSMLLDGALTNSGFRRSDEDDDRYFRSSIQEAFGKNIPDKYRSFEGNFPLGEGTICPSMACNIVLLVADDETTIYVEIWKI